MEKLELATNGSSMDIVQDNIAKLKQLFPDVFSEGKIDFEKLQETLGDVLEDKEERYNFTWHGKAQAKRIAQTVSTGTLLPCKKESKNWDTTQNLFIEGDNLEVLKLLQKSYHNQVKMIYIDPPYNTGKEFIYPDNYRDNLDTYMQYTGQKDNEGRKFGTNADTSGRYHTNWLNMMYPRLKLARNLLKDDGVIFISIDDNELTNLRKLCDEIFGEENFVANILWQKKTSPDARMNISAAHDHIILYTKKPELFELNFLPIDDARKKSYTNPDNDPRGAWASGDLTGQTGRAPKSQFYTITTPSGERMAPPEGRCWALAEYTFKDLVSDNRIWFGANGSNRPRLKKFLSESSGVRPWTWWDNKSVGHNQEGSQELKSIFDNQTIFDNPKPTRLLQRIIQLATNPEANETILDFFSGSATCAHSLFQQNILDNGNRKFIVVQLPEPISLNSNEFKSDSIAFKAGYKTIADIGKERIRRAGEKILQDNVDKEGIENLDIGFKVFKLDSSNIKPWDADFDNLEDTLLSHVDNIKQDRSEEDVLYEILLKYGLNLTVPIEERSINGKTAYIIGLGALIVCLDNEITLDVVDGIGALKEELEPEVMRVVFKDSGFKDDVVKTNAIQNLKRFGIDDVKSL